MSSTDNMTGWATTADGRRVRLSAAECDDILARVEARKQARAEAMPDVQAALNTMRDAWLRLKELGWREAIYCPKDGSEFDAIEAGSTGIFRCYYSGEWPKGCWWALDGGDVWPSRPILFRLDPEKEAAEKARMAEAIARYHADLEAENVKR